MYSIVGGFKANNGNNPGRRTIDLSDTGAFNTIYPTLEAGIDQKMPDIVRAPGIIDIPLCKASEAIENWKKYTAGQKTNWKQYPCNKVNT
jgi:hypothetical protein